MKLKYLILVIIFNCSKSYIHSQSSSINIQGRLTDTLNAPLPGATILLLDPLDTTLISYIKSENDGSFNFKGVKRMKYIVKANYLGFLPYMYLLDPADEKLNDLGIIKLKEIASELMEVVIKAAKAPISIRGDTIEYDASTFKVPAGSTVEDLLRRLPGMEVDANGGLKSEGKDVTKVTVEGKRFFGTDPSAATKNLPAEGISKIQIFNEETEEKKLTGVSSKPADKTMNLQLKEEFKKGGFGKMVAGAGLEETYELKGNYNKFNSKEQFSIIGNANTTGRNGLSWNDYQDFKGSSANNWDDDGEFGFGSGGDRYISYSTDDDDSGSSFFGGGKAGFPENYTGGVNYNFDHKKNSLTATYFYNQKALTSNTLLSGQTFLPDANLNNLNESLNENINKNHSIDFRYENKIDSLNTILISSNTSFGDQNNNNSGLISLKQQLIDTSIISNESNFDNSYNRSSYLTKVSAIYRKKFRKKGRSLGLSSSFIFNQNDKNAEQYSDNKFYDKQGSLDSILLINQLNTTKSTKNEIAANAMFTEPIIKKFYWSGFYNFNHRNEDLNRDVFDKVNGDLVVNDFLTRIYDNTIQVNRVGSFLRYSNQGTNISAGIANQRLDLNGNFSSGPSSGLSGIVDRTFYNWLPNLDMNFDLRGNKSFNLSYGVSAKEPSIRELQPIVDNSNPLYIKIGNPDLKPQIEHDVSLGFHKFDPATFLNISANINFSYYDNQFVSDQIVDENFVTNSRSINYSGGQSVWTWMNFGFPIIKNKFTFNINYNPNYSKSFAFVNEIKNTTNTLSNRVGFNINFTPNPKLSIYFNGSVNVSDTRYDISSGQNQTTLDQNFNVDLNMALFWGLYMNSSFNYSKFENARFGFNRERPILNISLYKLVLKNNRGEVRLALYDAFNKNLSINQSSNFNSVTQTSTSTLSRYAMVSFSYNIRGIVASTKKDSWW